MDVQGIVLLETTGNTVGDVANAATEALTEDMLTDAPLAYPHQVEHDAVLTFSADFACHIEGCVPNILNAGYGANLLLQREIRN